MPESELRESGSTSTFRMEHRIAASLAATSGIIALMSTSMASHDDDFVRCMITIGVVMLGLCAVLLSKSPVAYGIYFIAAIISLFTFASLGTLYRYSIPLATPVMSVSAFVSVPLLLMSYIAPGRGKNLGRRLLVTLIGLALVVHLLSAAKLLLKA